MVSSMGGYGCKKYEVLDGGEAQKIDVQDKPLFISVIQAFEDTAISTVEAMWDAPADVDGIVIPAGMCLYVKAKSVTITSGSGVIYYGIASSLRKEL